MAGLLGVHVHEADALVGERGLIAFGHEGDSQPGGDVVRLAAVCRGCFDVGGLEAPCTAGLVGYAQGVVEVGRQKLGHAAQVGVGKAPVARSERMAGWHAEHQLGAVQEYRVVNCGIGAARNQRYVSRPLGHQGEAGVAGGLEQAQGNAGLVGGERGEVALVGMSLAYAHGAGGVGEGEAAAQVLAQGGRMGLQAPYRVQCLARLGEQLEAGRRRPHARRGSIEQADPKLALEGGEPRRDRLLGNARLARSLREASAAACGVEVFELGQVHDALLPRGMCAMLPQALLVVG